MKSSVVPLFFLLLGFSLFFSIFSISSSVAVIISGTLGKTQFIKDGDALVSPGGTFRLGFFSLGSSENRYLGIWYDNIPPLTPVWVANRETPLLDTSGVLNITPRGSLALLNRTNGVVWSSNSSIPVTNPVAQLLESGNLVVKEANERNPGNFLWQSFDHPSDTLLPGMKIGVNKITGQKWSLVSWRSSDDPSPGDYELAVDPNRFSQMIVYRNNVLQSMSGPYNGEGYNGEPGLKDNPYIKLIFVYNQNESYYTSQVREKSVISRLLFNSAGMLQRYIWFNDTRGWVLYTTVVMGTCHRYGVCGPYGNCNMNNFQTCGCLKGFAPKYPKDSDIGDWSKGCVRKTPLDCKRGDGFEKLTGIKLPDTRHFWYNETMSLEECKQVCLKSCSCTGYANAEAKGGGSGCLNWFEELVDIRVTPDNPQDMYVRMAASEIGNIGYSNAQSSNKNRTKVISIAVSISGMMLLGLLLALYVFWKKKKKKQLKIEEPDDEDLDVPCFDWATMENATNNFSFQNKLGEGGFGPVYKGILKDGQAIAVKRLSSSSKQGVDEFKNEVIHIAKLQHRNLVRLLGYCIKTEEKLLIYEHMPNKSLDSLIFDQNKSTGLEWSKRFRIINGIARGLVYLHQDSRLRIIHRDLKASNVLLDNEMNAKISDFGLARSFGGDETEGNTRRVVGTYGYMSPEYAIDGIYSVKSDVYSFGVLVLEIVTGKRNRGFHHPDHSLNLLGHAWKLHMEHRSLDLVDPSIADTVNATEIVRSIHVGLLCVQRRAEDRPIMSSVVLMLSGDGTLAPPKQPGFFNERDPFESDSSSGQFGKRSSTNDMSITLLDPR